MGLQVHEEADIGVEFDLKSEGTRATFLLWSLSSLGPECSRLRTHILRINHIWYLPLGLIWGT